MTDFMICMRKKKTKSTSLLNEIGPTVFLAVPHDQQNVDTDQSITRKEWQTALCENLGDSISNNGNIVCLIHCAQTDAAAALACQRQFAKQLQSQGYPGLVIGIDWAAPATAINDWEDREHAREAARRLRDDCIAMLCMRQKDCNIEIHVMAHGSGAFVLREAMSLADEKQSYKNSFWSLNHVAFIGADISSRSLRSEDPRSAALYRHCHSLSNYQNPYDEHLSLAHSKQQPVSERAGRCGLAYKYAHPKSININAEEQFSVVDAHDKRQNPLICTNFSHTWYLFNHVLIEDFLHSIRGKIDRRYIPTRRTRNGELCLFDPESLIFLEE